MKYIVVLADGMADEPIEELRGKTPLQVAHTPNMDELAKVSEMGLVRTVPKGMSPGSDVANLSVIGYDPAEYYTGRSPIEALSIGASMEANDVSYRMNLVTLSEDETEFEEKRILDHSASEISTEDASVLLEDLKVALQREGYGFFLGTSYRHLLVWKDGECIEITPPHDILGKGIKEFLPIDLILREMMKKSYEVLKDHPINIERKKKGLNPANSAWFWGAGTKPNLVDFQRKTNKKGAMISAVDLLKGVAVGTNLLNIEVEGANGGLHTNYRGKAEAAVDVLLNQGYDFVYVHIEAPDEMGHQGALLDKIKAIEEIDAKVVGKIQSRMGESGVEYRVLILSDHPTPIKLRTHTDEPVPYLLYDSTREKINPLPFDEDAAKRTGYKIEKGHELMDYFLE